MSLFIFLICWILYLCFGQMIYEFIFYRHCFNSNSDVLGLGTIRLLIQPLFWLSIVFLALFPSSIKCFLQGDKRSGIICFYLGRSHIKLVFSFWLSGINKRVDKIFRMEAV